MHHQPVTMCAGSQYKSRNQAAAGDRFPTFGEAKEDSPASPPMRQPRPVPRPTRVYRAAQLPGRAWAIWNREVEPARCRAASIPLRQEPMPQESKLPIPRRIASGWGSRRILRRLPRPSRPMSETHRAGCYTGGLPSRSPKRKAADAGHRNAGFPEQRFVAFEGG